MLPSPEQRKLGLRRNKFRGHLWVHLRCGPVTRSPSYRWLCQSASDHSVSLLSATQATGLLTRALAGLPPAGCASLRLDALGSQYRSAAESLSFSLRSFDQSTANGRPNPEEESVSYSAVTPCRMLLAVWHLLRFASRLHLKNVVRPSKVSQIAFRIRSL